MPHMRERRKAGKPSDQLSMSVNMVAFFLVIPTKKWLLDRNLIKQGFLKGFSDNTQITKPGADSYNDHFEGETDVLRQKNGLFWDVSFENSADRFGPTPSNSRINFMNIVSSRKMIFDEFLKRVCPARGLNWRKYRRASRRRMLARIYELGLKGFGEYADFIDSSPEEEAFLPNLLRVTVSRFFREKDLWKYLADDILPAMINENSVKRPLQILHIGSCNGEEPYSMALLWKTEIEPFFPDAAVSITALEIDPDCLERAEKGWFAPKTLREVPARILRDWFVPGAEGYELHDCIKDMVFFKRFDLLNEDLPREQDIIFCRYLIYTYFKDQRRQDLTRQILRSLRPGGVLVLGQKETIHSLENNRLVRASDTLNVFRLAAMNRRD